MNKKEWVLVTAFTIFNGYFFFANMSISADRGIVLEGSNFENALWPYHMVIFFGGLTIMFIQIPPVKRLILR